MKLKIVSKKGTSLPRKSMPFNIKKLEKKGARISEKRYVYSSIGILVIVCGLLVMGYGLHVPKKYHISHLVSPFFSNHPPHVNIQTLSLFHAPAIIRR